MPCAMTMPKVLHIGPCDSPGGMANVMKILAEHPPEGWEAELLASHVVGSPWAKWRAYRKARSTLIRTLNDPTQRPDVVHLHTAADWSWWRKRRFALLAHAAGCKIVVHIHSGKFDQWLGDSNSKRSISFRTFTEKIGAKTVVLSNDWKERLDPRIGLTYVVNNPIPEVLTVPIHQRDRHHLLLLGRNDSVKGHDFAACVAAELLSDFPNLKLTMTGKESSTHTWMSARGWVDEDEKIYLLQKASILLVPSTFEGQPLVVLESLACGLPVIVSDMVPTGDLPVGKARYQDSDAWKKAIQGVFDSPPDSLQLKESVDQYRITQVTKMWLEVYTR